MGDTGACESRRNWSGQIGLRASLRAGYRRYVLLVFKISANILDAGVICASRITATPQAGGGTSHRRPIEAGPGDGGQGFQFRRARRSEEHTSELQSLMRISYAVFCLKKKKSKIQLIEHVINFRRVEKTQH